MKLAQSGTKEGIISCINKFYYTTTITVNFENGEVSNSKGLIKGVTVQTLKRKFIFKSI